MCLRVKKTFFIFGTLIFSLIVFANLCLAEIAIIRIHYRDAYELLPIIENLLSTDGRVSVDTNTNALVIKDTPEAIDRVREVASKLDKAPEQLTIRFRFQEERLSRETDVSVSGRVSGDEWSVATGRMREDGVGVRVRDSEKNRHRTLESFVTVNSGESAYIQVGTDIPYTQRWYYLSRQYAPPVETVTFKTIETGFEIRPVVSGDHVRIDIVPRISRMGRGRVIHFTEAATSLVVPRGEWVTIGGISETKNEVIRDILSRGSSEECPTGSMSLMVEP